MAGGLVGLFDDIAALAKLAAASVDDVALAAGKASAKAAGVVVDDAAVTPAYVRGLAAERELPIIKRIALGSLRNKILIILPIALLLSAVAPKVVEVILMFGGCFLAYEGAHKIIHALHHDEHDHDVPVTLQGPDAEQATVSGAIRTDFILSAEIMVISLKEVLDEPLVARGIILVLVGVLITVVVYGIVALIVKMDDIGLKLVERPSPRSQRIGRLLVAGMPKLLRWLSVIGVAAMLWVGGHIILVGFDELGWTSPYHLVHELEHLVSDVPGVGGVLAWLVNTAASALVGLVVGMVIATVVDRLPFKKRKAAVGAVAEDAHEGGHPNHGAGPPTGD
jgi:predicted DNA repair protein MutK